jgi:hypothetical protein
MLDRRRRGNGPHCGSRHRKFPIRLNPSQFDGYGFETCDTMFRHSVTSRCEPFPWLESRPIHNTVQSLVIELSA